jgi:hypothetical protein
MLVGSMEYSFAEAYISICTPKPWQFDGYVFLDHFGRNFNEQVKILALRLNHHCTISLETDQQILFYEETMLSAHICVSTEAPSNELRVEVVLLH